MVYLIVNYQENICKIGYSANPIKRLSSLQTGCPYPLYLVSQIDGGFFDEGILHERYHKYRIGKEWFEYSDEIKLEFGVSESSLNESFTQVYDSFLALSKDMQYKVSWQLLFWLFKQMNDNNGIQIGKHTFETFNKYLLIDCPDCVISRPTFDRAVNDLINVKVLTKVGKGFYYLNPHLFWKGSKKNRIEFIKDENKEARYLSHNPSNQLVDENIIQIQEKKS